MGFFSSIGNFVGNTVGSLVGGVTGGIVNGILPTNQFQATAPELEGDEARKARFMAALANQGQYQTQQADLANQLAQQAQGQGISGTLAQSLLQRSQDQNLAQTRALAGSARGNINPALLQRQMMQQNAIGNQQLGTQAAQFGMQQQLGAQQQLGGLLNNAAGQGLNYEQLSFQNALEQARNKLAAQQINAQTAQSNTQARAQTTGGLLSGGAAAIAASDERLKENVTDGSKDIRGFLDAIGTHKYKYKDEKWGKGPHVSVMAQELEKTPVGKQMVIDTAEGKMVDYGKGFAAILAAQADLNKRLKSMGA